MSKPPSRIVQGLLRLHSYSAQSQIPKPSPLSRAHHHHHSSSSSSAAATPIRFRPSGSSNAFPPRPPPTRHGDHPAFSSGAGLGLRFFSFRASDLGGKGGANFAKKAFGKPAAAVASSFSRYRGAIGLQIEAFFKRNYLFVLGAGGVMACALLWRIMFGIANTFIGFSEGMAKYGFLALSSAIVAFAVSSLCNLLITTTENSDFFLKRIKRDKIRCLQRERRSATQTPKNTYKK